MPHVCASYTHTTHAYVTPWNIPISIDHCVCNWFWRLSFNWICAGNWFRRLSILLELSRQMISAIVYLIDIVQTTGFGCWSINGNCPDIDFRCCLLCGIVWTIGFGCCLLNGIVRTSYFGGWKLIGIVRKIYFRGRPRNQSLEKCHDLLPFNWILIDTPHWIDTTRNEAKYSSNCTLQMIGCIGNFPFLL